VLRRPEYVARSPFPDKYGALSPRRRRRRRRRRIYSYSMITCLIL